MLSPRFLEHSTLVSLLKRHLTHCGVSKYLRKFQQLLSLYGKAPPTWTWPSWEGVSGGRNDSGTSSGEHSPAIASDLSDGSPCVRPGFFDIYSDAGDSSQQRQIETLMAGVEVLERAFTFFPDDNIDELRDAHVDPGGRAVHCGSVVSLQATPGPSGSGHDGTA